MALIEEALHSMLVGLVSGRVYGHSLPRPQDKTQVVLPAITYMKVSGPRDQTQQGPSGLVSARFQVSSWGKTYGATKTLSDSVRQALDGYMGITDGVRIAGIELINETDQFESEPNVFQTILDFRVKHSEQIA